MNRSSAGVTTGEPVGFGARGTMNILGISAYYHDSAAVLVRDGDIVAAAQEERFTRLKHDPGFPEKAIQYCLEEGEVVASDLDLVVFYDKPFLKFERILETSLGYAPLGIRSFLRAMPLWLKQKLWLPQLLSEKLDFEGKVLFPEHHESHAASAFFPSPFEEAAILTMDGVGEWATTSFGTGRGKRIELASEIRFPHSLGLLYSAFTYYTGFRVNSGEYKVMGLAPYGEPKYVDLILDKLVDLKADGSFKLDMKYFNYCTGLTMTNDRFHKLFGGPPREPESAMRQRDMDLARSIQVVTEEVMLRMVRHVHAETGCENLCLAGGVALNCVGNGRILREGPFKRIWIQPAAGDAGGALGAALLAWYQVLGNERIVEGERDVQKASLLGPSFSDEEVERSLRERGASYRLLEAGEVAGTVARLLADGRVVGWFQGRMEFGPRALGSRSIIGDARSKTMQSIMNLKIKYRESFRPFAPTVLAERVSDYFEIDRPSPYMLLVAPVRKEHRIEMTGDQEALFGIDRLNVPRSDVPAVTHIDYTARIQTVSRADNPVYYDMIDAFSGLTGCPVIINTSFNVRGEPIVCTPEDAYLCFMRTEMEYLIVGRCLLDKAEQKPIVDDVDWRKTFKLD